eukprot:TRINITY_DN7872_c0_g3_i2.p1 TRINITY_DN7872_c0_g3~~TRINITY_DN7872_c0_g3_i2.p1  ORF type:complete len:419 (+),score=79.09 TRINITY_DN7872_c0_g3_i2:106-1257(+)
MERICKCLQHDRVNELYCKTCTTYICPECIVKHTSSCPNFQLVHIYDYAPQVALPLIDHLLKDLSGKDSEMNLAAAEFTANLVNILPSVKATVNSYVDSMKTIEEVIKNIETHVNSKQQSDFAEQIRKGLIADKKRLEEALKAKDITTLVGLTKKIEAEKELEANQKKDMELVGKIMKDISLLADTKVYKEIVDSMQLVLFKCQHFRLNQCIVGWKCDRGYLSAKMTLSEDGLTFGNHAGNGYPAIIGDTPFDSGILAYTATPFGLCCSGKEGFGIIPMERYKAKYAADSTTPTVYDEMIGLQFGNVAKNMKVIKGSQMANGKEYTVVANMHDLVMTIKGPDCDIRAELTPGTLYVPCFSCGCRNNKLVIKPLEAYDVCKNTD